MQRTSAIFLLFSFLHVLQAEENGSGETTRRVNVGVVLDLATLVGKIGRTSILMAIDDFYSFHGDYTTRLFLHTRDFNDDIVQAASAGERVEHILSRLVVVIWMFVVLVLTSSYTASLSSMLTVQQLGPTVTDLRELQKNGDYVGRHTDTFVEDFLKQLNFDESKLRVYGDPEDYIQALSKGSKNGGVSAIVHEIPYIKLFLAQHCTGYTMVGPIYKTAGFGFVFPKGSPLVPDISSGILNVMEGDDMLNIEKKWFGDPNACLNQARTVTSSNLEFRSFSGLFLITGVVSTCSLLIVLFIFWYNNQDELRNINPDKPIWTRLIGWFKYYSKRDQRLIRRKNSTQISGNTNIRDDKTIESSQRIDELQHQKSTLNSHSGPREEERYFQEETSPETQPNSIIVTV